MLDSYSIQLQEALKLLSSLAYQSSENESFKLKEIG